MQHKLLFTEVRLCCTTLLDDISIWQHKYLSTQRDASSNGFAALNVAALGNRACVCDCVDANVGIRNKSYECLKGLEIFITFLCSEENS